MLSSEDQSHAPEDRFFWFYRDEYRKTEEQIKQARHRQKLRHQVFKPRDRYSATYTDLHSPNYFLRKVLLPIF